MKPSFRIPAYLLLAVFILSACHVSAQEEEFLNKINPGINLSN